MALLSELVAVCEAHRVDSGATLNVFARRLREAGRVSKAGRGRGAAHMTFLDAARFLIACAATDHPEQAADAEFQFSNTLFDETRKFAPAIGIDAKSTPTLDLALARFLEIIADPSIEYDEIAKVEAEAGFGPDVVPRLVYYEFVVLRGTLMAQIRARSGECWFSTRLYNELIHAPDYLVSDRLSAAMEVESHRFRTGKNLVAQFRGPLLKDVADLIAGSSRKETLAITDRDTSKL